MRIGISKMGAYWWCQVAGWGGNMLMNFFFAWTYNRDINASFVLRSLIIALLGLIITHFMRWVIIQTNLLHKTFERQVVYFLVLHVVPVHLSFSF